ncbi:tryptophan synthase subunit alpha [Methanocaldococcus indicus]|uniref:tryptophan synthase subunit alpha n=1 Tax=Methanocaldococcus indicus TaxID=213231 RepID=UPI003C6CE876
MKIEEKFKELNEKEEKAFIPFLVAGDPNFEDSKEAFEMLCKYGDIIEIGIPFSDPVADGLTIQKADYRALKSGMTPLKAFELAKYLNEKYPNKPLVFLVYYNIIFKMGEENFVKKAKESGISGLIVPDLPVEESESLYNICKKYGIDLIFLVAPTTTEERLNKILKKASGFIYAVSVTGITGERDKVKEETKNYIKKVKEKTSLPICVGFGISKKEHVEEICKIADGAIVGSAIVKIVEKYTNNYKIENKEKFLEELENFLKSLKDGTKTAIKIKN